MKKTNGALIGLIFVTVGLLYACSALNLFHFSIFFPGWWTLFIIIPCLYGLFKKGDDKTGCLFGLFIGICFLINAQNWAFHIDFWPMMIAIVCLLIGIKLIFPKKHKKVIQVEIDGEERSYKHVTKDGCVSVSAILGGKEVRIDNEVFASAEIKAVLGGAELDLRNAIISEDTRIEITTVLGGADIYLPADVKVVTDDCTAVLGGVDVSRAYVNVPAADAPKVIITGCCILGGIDIH